MVYEFDIEAMLKLTMKCILERFVPIILYTNSKLLYDYLVKLGTIQEKCLMVDLIYL